MALACGSLWAPRGQPIDEATLRRAFLDDPGVHFSDGEEPVLITRFGGMRGGPTLGVVHDPVRGFAMEWNRPGPTLPMRERHMLSVADPAAMHVPVPHPAEEVQPQGAFLTGDVALRVALDFDRDPMVLSGAVGWMPYEDVPESARRQI